MGRYKTSPIVMRAVVTFAARRDQVSVSLGVTRTQFPDFEARIHIDETFYIERESMQPGPITGLNQALAPLITEIVTVTGKAPTPRCCGGSCA